jgi:hypothetical protein
MVDILQQTLRPASSVDFTLTELAPTCEAVQGTVANLQDGNDGTGSSLSAAKTGIPNANGTYREEWVLDPAIAGNIAFLRIVARTKRADSGGAASFTASYRPSINGTPRGVVHAVGAVADDVQDFPADPADGAPWTLAKVNAERFGWFLTAGVVAPPLSVDDVVTCSVVDFRVELWGPEPSAAPTPVHTLGPFTQERIADEQNYWGGRRT